MWGGTNLTVRGPPTTTRLVRLLGALPLLAILAPRPAGAQPTSSPVDGAAPDVLPFTGSELEDALAARIRPTQLRLVLDALVVEPAGGGDVRLRLGDRRALVAVGDRRGPGAARVVALVVADLLEEAFPAASVPVEAPTPASRRAAVPSMRLTLAPGVAAGLAPPEPTLFVLGLEAMLPDRGRWQLIVGASFGTVPRRDRGTPTELAFQAWSVRLGAALRLGPIEAEAGLFATPYSIAGALPHSGSLFGVGAAARYAPRLVGPVLLVARAGVDVYGNRIALAESPGAAPYFATPRAALSLTLGLAWELGW